MPDNKRKKKKTPARAENVKPLRQTTLLESASSPARPRKPPNANLKPITPERPKRKYVSESSESSDIGAIKLGPVTPGRIADDEGDRSQSPLPPRNKRRQAIVIDSESDEKKEQSSTTDSSAVIVPRKRRLRKLTSKSSKSSGDKPPASRRVLSKSKAEQVDSDGQNLSDEVDEDRIIEPRLRSRGKKTIFQKNLERLKRKKMGKPMTSSESSEGGEEYSQSEEDDSKPFKGARPANSSADGLFTENDESDSSFIVEDDSQAVAAQLPSEFSMRSHDDLSHQFKIIFQFFVHVAVRPTIDRRGFMENQMKNQEYFSFPLKITRRKLSGLRDSLIASSVWRPKFKKALEDYPTLETVALDFAVPSCDACHLGGRLSTILGRLGGIPYDRIGFMDNITSDSEENSGDDSEGSVTRLNKSEFGFLEFHLGRFCARRVRIYHAFSHWEYHLFNVICSELDDIRAAKRNRGFVRVAFAGGRRPPDDPTDADGLCEWLDERGIIDQEWNKMKTMMESAHHLEISAKKGEED